jgi:hypothetical protein
MEIDNGSENEKSGDGSEHQSGHPNDDEGAIFESGVDKTALDFAGLRVGQMDNCELCVGQSLSGVDRNAGAKSKRFSTKPRAQGLSCSFVR